jgi:energy-coupling factor transporter transmembrane protein EcfT
MDPLFLRLEATPFSVWIRESTSVWAYPAILSAHAIGMGLAAGVNAAIALHLLGVGSGIPTREMRRFVPVMWLGFWLNAASGVMLLIAYPTKAFTNPVFYLKISLIALAMWTFVVINRRIFRAATPHVGSGVGPTAGPIREHDGTFPGLRPLAIASLVCWAGAITAGRLLAYTYARLLATW